MENNTNIQQELLDVIVAKPHQLDIDINIILKSIIESISYEYLCDSLKDDFDLAVLAIKKNTRNFRYLSERLKDSKDLALLALEQNDNNRVMLSDLSERLKKDKEIALLAMEKDVANFRYIDKVWFEDPDFITACLKDRKYFYGSPYEVFAPQYQNDREITLKMSLGRGFPLEAVPEKFKNDKEIVRNSIKSKEENIKYLGSELKQDKNFLEELYLIDNGILFYMDEEIKSKFFTTKICSKEHYGRKLIYEKVFDGCIINSEIQINCAYIQEGKVEVMRFENFPILTYEGDGPVGSYLKERYLCNIIISGNFVFFSRENSGLETSTHHLSKNHSYLPPQSNDDFLKHEVYLIPESTNIISYNNLEDFPRLYFGTSQFFPIGVKLFPEFSSYNTALTMLSQKKAYGKSEFKRINNHTLQTISEDLIDIYGAAEVYVDGYGWRFLIPHQEGTLKALEVLKSTTMTDDLNWLKSQNGVLDNEELNSKSKLEKRIKTLEIALKFSNDDHKNGIEKLIKAYKILLKYGN